jgi:biopolymer transport protein ExbD
MLFRRNEEEEARLGIAPLIDIVFLLLIFFMVTSHFDVASGVKIRLPKIAQRLYEKNEDRITLVIDASGSMHLNGEKVEAGSLKEALEETIFDKDTVDLILKADRDVKHGIVVETMDLAKRSGIRSIIIAAGWKPEGLP